MHWKKKAALFRLFDAVPFGDDLHFLAQRHVTKTWPRPIEDVQALIGVARRNIDDFNRLSSKPLAEAAFFEIGAGRDLIVPLAMRALGAGCVVAADINRLAKLDLINAAAKMIGDALTRDVPQFQTWDDLEAFGVVYAAPLDAADATNLPSRIDAFISNEVLEHVPENALIAIFRNVARRMPPGGLSLHSIDYSDHYARDGGVSRYNFLQFSDEEWRPFNAGMHYVNRLRHSQYVGIMRNAGLRIIDEDTYSEDIPTSIAIAEQFKRFDLDDLRVMRSRLCAVKD